MSFVPFVKENSTLHLIDGNFACQEDGMISENPNSSPWCRPTADEIDYLQRFKDRLTSLADPYPEYSDCVWDNNTSYCDHAFKAPMTRFPIPNPDGEPINTCGDLYPDNESAQNVCMAGQYARMCARQLYGCKEKGVKNHIGARACTSDSTTQTCDPQFGDHFEFSLF